MFGIDSNIIVIVIAVILFILVVKLLTRFFFRLIAIVIFAGLSLYFIYYHTDFFDKNQDNRIVQIVENKIDFLSITTFQDKFCSKKIKSRTDSITCECIIDPIVNDLLEHFTQEELKILEKDKKRYMKEILASLKRNKMSIMKELAKRDATDVWDSMLKELRNGKFLQNN